MKSEDILFLCECVLIATLICIALQIVDDYDPFWLLT